MTKRATQLWAKYSEGVKRCGYLATALGARKAQYDLITEFAPQFIDSELERQTRSWFLIFARAVRSVGLVNSEKYGVQYTAGKRDLDIVAPPHYTREQIAADFGAVPLLLLAGIVVAGAILTGIAITYSEARKAIKKYHGIVDTADELLKSDPAKAAEWEAAKARVDWPEKEFSITEALANAGSKLTTGISAGLAVLIVVVGASWLAKR